MSVSSIFKTLIIVVVCIIIGAAVINVFAPNLVAQVSNAIENSIFQATGMTFDLNGDKISGTDTTKVNTRANTTNNTSAGVAGNAGNNVSGFKAGK